MTSTTITAVDRLLAAIAEGSGVGRHLFAADARLDATVPHWRFARHGADAVAAQYTAWFAERASFEELERHEIDCGEVVTYLLTWESDGVPFAARHCHVLRLDDRGRIASDQFFCGGRWSAGELAQMAAASDAG